MDSVISDAAAVAITPVVLVMFLRTLIYLSHSIDLVSGDTAMGDWAAKGPSAAGAFIHCKPAVRQPSARC